MIRHRYEPIPEMTRAEALGMLDGTDGLSRSKALLSLALYDPDWRWVQNLSLKLLDDPDSGLKGTAALALAHLARIHRALDLDVVLPALERLKSDRNIGGRVEDALSDIQIYVKR
jgi:hypothetical protein